MSAFPKLAHSMKKIFIADSPNFYFASIISDAGIFRKSHILINYIVILRLQYYNNCKIKLENETSRKLAEVFDMYADVDEGFIRTKIPVKEACISGEPVARSQAVG